MNLFRLVNAIWLAAGLSACATTGAIELVDAPDSEVPVFAGDAAIDRFVAEVEADQQRWNERYAEELERQRQMIVVTASMNTPPNITNVQEQGVDEGGIVKLAGDYLVVLRRGRLFTVRHAGGVLEPVDQIDVFPPNGEDADDAWYDEMLTSGNRVVTIGYAYGERGTELSRFDISTDGMLTYVDTHYLSSGDYYSSRNYASRLIDGQLLFYAPYEFGTHDWRENLPNMTLLQKDGTLAEPVFTANTRELAVARPYAKSPRKGLTNIHAVTSCDLMDPAFTCNTRMVVGGRSRNFYMSRDATFIWTGLAPWDWYGSDRDEPWMLYRIPHHPLDPVTAVQVKGSPIDQFSFLDDAETGTLHVLVEEAGFGDEMWGAEFADGPLFLLQLPQDKMGDGSVSVPLAAYRALPGPDDWGIQNRFVGGYLVYAASNYGRDDKGYAFVTPLEEGWVQRITLPHGTSRLDRLGDDAIVIGRSADDELGFSSIFLDPEDLGAELVSTYMLPSAREGESRSQAFFYLPDEGSDDGQDGLMALPVEIEQEDEDLYDKYGNRAAVFFLRRDQRLLSPVGQLDAAQVTDVEDGCIASCYDWYGDARPIFLGDRIFGLLGYEIVEGAITGGEIREIRRVDFTPSVDGKAAAD